MRDRYFVSYSRVDLDLALRLAEELASGPPEFPVWLDQWNLQPGTEWDDQIEQAIADSRGLLCLASEDSVGPGSGCKDEWARALAYKKPVVPVLLSGGVTLPMRLGSRQYVDLTGDFEAGLARLRRHLQWRETPDGQVQELRERLDDARRALPRAATDGDRRRIEADVENLSRLVEERVRVARDPDAARARTEDRIASGLDRERRPEDKPVVRRAKFVNKPPVTPPRWFQGREREVGEIADFLVDDGRRLLLIAGRGGVGKTALACHVLKSVQDGRPVGGVDQVGVSGIVYLSPVGAHLVNFPNLFRDLTRLLPDEQADPLLRRQETQGASEALVQAVLEALPDDAPTVVLLDNFEDLVDPHTYALKDADVDLALRTILSAPEHRLKVVITSRTVPADLLYLHPSRQRRLDLDAGLGSPYAENLLRAMDPDGRLGLSSAPDKTLLRAKELTRGYPRALEALVAILTADRDTTIDDLLERTSAEQVVEALVGEAVRRLDRYDQLVLQAVAVYDAPVPSVAVDHLLEPFVAGIDSAPILSRLVNNHFLFRERHSYYLHPVDRAHILTLIPPADATPNLQLFRGRAADYYEQIRLPRDTWRTMQDIEPQLREFRFRCDAQDFEQAADVLTSFFWPVSRWTDPIFLTRMVEELLPRLTDAARRCEGLQQFGRCLNNLARYDEAWPVLDEALEIARSLGALEEECHILRQRGWLLVATDHYEDALRLLDEGLVMARLTGNLKQESSALSEIAWCHFALSRYAEALLLLTHALGIALDVGDRVGQGIVRNDIATCLIEQGQYDAALTHMEAGLALSREAGSRDEESRSLFVLGLCRTAQGHFAEALASFAEALAITRDINDRVREGDVQREVGRAYIEQGSYAEALPPLYEALNISRITKRRRGEGHTLRDIGLCRLGQGHHADAIGPLEDALAIAKDIGDRHGEGRALLGTARCLVEQGGDTQPLLNEAVAIFEEIGAEPDAARARALLAEG